MHNLIIVIPSYNEKKLLYLIKKLKKKQILIIDDGSKIKINTQIKETNKLRIIKNKKNKGYEYSLLKALKLAANNSRYILTMDADGEHLCSNINKFYIYARNNKVDLLIGSRSRLNRLSEKLLSLLFSMRYNIKDPLSGFKIYDSAKLKKMIYRNKFKEDFLIDLIKNFIVNKFIVKNYNIKSSKNNLRRSSLSNFKTTFKILALVKYL